jgi:hypothetical protein
MLDQQYQLYLLAGTSELQRSQEELRDGIPVPRYLLVKNFRQYKGGEWWKGLWQKNFLLGCGNVRKVLLNF